MSLGGQQSISYKEIVETICDRIGEEYIDISDHDRRRIRRSIQFALEFIWDFQVWPMLRRFARRTYYPDYAADEAVDEGAVRYSGTGYWTALRAGTLAEPSEESEDWEVYTVSERFIPWSGLEGVIGIPKTVFGYDPTLYDHGIRYPFTLSADGIYLRSDAPDVVWVEYLPPVPTLRGDSWEEGEIYAAGDQSYYESASDFFIALDSTTGDVPGKSPDKWQRLEIPAIFKGYLVWEALGGEYSGEGMTKQRLAAEAKAQDMLYRAVDIALGMTGTHVQPLGGGRNR